MKNRLDNMLKTMDSLMCQLRGVTLTNEEFEELAKRFHVLSIELLVRRTHEVKEFEAALNNLQRIRNTVKSK